ncbi:hypothetical protein EVA_17550, partial [gut metagenome]
MISPIYPTTRVDKTVMEVENNPFVDIVIS